MEILKIKVGVGQIYEILEDMPVCTEIKELGGRKILLGKGEKIEIRYPYAWHFRTQDNIYLQVSEETLLKYCKLFGEIWENVRYQNTASLEEILRLRLFKQIK